MLDKSYETYTLFSNKKGDTVVGLEVLFTILVKSGLSETTTLNIKLPAFLCLKN